MKTGLEFLHKNQEAWEEVLKPNSQDQPLIRLWEDLESGKFEAVFAYELEGVTREVRNQAAKEQDTAADLYGSYLISGLSSGQGLDFVYGCGRDTRGNENFSLRIMGCSSDSTPEGAMRRTHDLRQNLKVALGNIERDYRFIPIAKHRSPEETAYENIWICTVQSLGFAVDAGGRKQIGFKRQDKPDTRSMVIIAPQAGDRGKGVLDTSITGAFKCPALVKIVLSVTHFTLSNDDLLKVAAAAEWLQDSETKRIRFRQDIKGDIEDPEVLKGLKHNLMLWLKSPSGYRISCTVMSGKQIPSSLLIMLGNEVFKGEPVVISTENRAEEDARDAVEVLGNGILDLRGCINSASRLPSLFPDTSNLIDHGVKRVYRQSAPILLDSGIVLGKAGDCGSEREIRFARADRSRHCYIVGATGTGKSTLLYNMIVQDIENGEGVALIDPHGDLYDQVLNAIPEKRASDVVLIDPCDFAQSVGINFLECDEGYKPVQMNHIANEMIKIFDRFYNMRIAGGPVFEQFMRNALLLVMDSRYPGATLMDVPLVFEDDDYRNFLKARCNNPIVVNFWEKQAERVAGDHSLKNIAPYITSKLNQFTTNALLRPVIGQSKSTVNFREMMDNGKILLVNLSKGLLGELDTQLLGMLIIGKIFSSGMGRVRIRPEERKPVFLYIDEFQNFTTDSIAHLLSESRKFGIHLTLANQNLAQLAVNDGKQNILDSVLGNVGSILAFRMGVADVEKIKTYMTPELDAYDLQGLPDFHVASRLLVRNVPSRPFVFQTLAGQASNQNSRARRIVNMLPKRYTRPTGMIEEEINKRMTAYRDA